MIFEWNAFSTHSYFGNAWDWTAGGAAAASGIYVIYGSNSYPANRIRMGIGM